MVVTEVKSPSEAGLCLLPWARRTRVGRRNLLTTASSGSANGLQVISDRLADNFSILAGHHATGDNGDDGGEDGDGVGGDDSDGLEKGEGDGGGIMAKSFAMFECRREGAESQSVRSRGERGREGARALSRSLSPSISHCLSTTTLRHIQVNSKPSQTSSRTQNDQKGGAMRRCPL